MLFYCFTATGILKGFDQLLNLVLDGTIEHLRGTVLPRWINGGFLFVYNKKQYYLKLTQYIGVWSVYQDNLRCC